MHLLRKVRCSKCGGTKHSLLQYLAELIDERDAVLRLICLCFSADGKKGEQIFLIFFREMFYLMEKCSK
jgi:hypothetical protein